MDNLLKSEDENPKDVDELLSEIMKLKSENADLKSRINLHESLDKCEKSMTELIHEMREKNNKMMMEKDEEGRKLRLRMDEIEMEKQMADLKNKRNNTIYNQKMSVIHDIELENKIYREEVNDLKKKNEENELNAKTKIEKLDILNQLKFSQFKKRMINNLKEAKNNVSKLNLEYMDLNGKITILQNYQLLSEVEFQKKQYDNLLKENKQLKERIIDLEKELTVIKNVSFKLALKAKNYKEKIKVGSSRNNRMNIDLSNNNNEKELVKTIPERNIFSNNIIRAYSNKNNFHTIYNTNQGNHVDFPLQLNSDRGSNKIKELDFRYIKYNKIIRKKNEEIERLKLTNENYKGKLENYTGINKSLFLFLDECLNNFFRECKENYLFKNIKININDLKKFNFDNLKKEEKYGLLVLLMKYLFPFVMANYDKINEKEKIFKTNINITQVKKELQYNSPKKYVNDVCVKKSYGGKNFLSNLFVDNISTKNYQNNNIYKNKKKKDSPNDSRIKNNKYKSLID